MTPHPPAPEFLTPEESKQLCARLLEVLPEMKTRYDEILREWRGEDPGAYTVYEDLLPPALFSALLENDAPELVARIFELIEEICSTGSEAAQTMVAVCVLEGLVGDSQRLINAEPFMGVATRQALRRMESSYRIVPHGISHARQRLTGVLCFSLAAVALACLAC